MSMSAKRLSEILLAIESRAGKLTAKKVVDAARDPQHPLHSRFEWDDAIAAEKHRLQQARQLIDGLKVNVTHGSLSVAVPVYVKDPDASKGGGHIRLDAVPSTSQSAEDIVNLAARTALGHVLRVEAMAMTLGLGRQVSTATKNLNALVQATTK